MMTEQQKAHIRQLAAQPKPKRDMAYRKSCQRIDGWPWEAGIYTFNSEGPGLEAAQLRYNNFLKRMQLRKNFRILQQNMTTFFNGVSIFVTYQIDDTPVEDD